MSMTSSDSYGFPMGEYGEQMAEQAQLELERIQSARFSHLKQAPAQKPKPKSKGIRLKRSIEKFTAKLRFSNPSKESPTPPVQQLSEPYQDEAPEAPINNSLGLLHQPEEHSSRHTLGTLPTHEDILDADFHCRRIGIENLCLAEQNAGMAQELRLCQDTLTSLRRILQQKVERIDQLNASFGPESTRRF
ncbi:hypothetical protein DSO57_1029731 [Entomophthora muscae]|uniref:Uncharacterized protein n=1 Tax=Entomophthora muscae TaxID=34485 RepID=A0ACC2T147_9FUNG|nr:hypothetical protein DSO57_1029731 [Entomophthora muscae]